MNRPRLYVHRIGRHAAMWGFSTMTPLGRERFPSALAAILYVIAAVLLATLPLWAPFLMP